MSSEKCFNLSPCSPKVSSTNQTTCRSPKIFIIPTRLGGIKRMGNPTTEALDRGDLEQAKAELSQLVSLSPSSPEAHQRLGRVLEQQNRVDEAEACYSQALAARPRLRRRADRHGACRGPPGQPPERAQAVRDGHRDRAPRGDGPPGAGRASSNRWEDRRGAGRLLPVAGARPAARRGEPPDRLAPDRAERGRPGAGPARPDDRDRRRATPRPCSCEAGRTWR